MGAYWEPSKEEAIAAANNARSNLLNRQTTVAARAAAKAAKRARTAAAAAPAAESSIPPVAASIPTSAPVLTAGTLVPYGSGPGIQTHAVGITVAHSAIVAIQGKKSLQSNTA